MGTETALVEFKSFLLSGIVKLNNPLMGTETRNRIEGLLHIDNVLLN